MPAYRKGAVVPTWPLYKHRGDWSGYALAMFLRSKRRFKDGKAHRYFSGMENRRVRSGRETLEVFDEAEQRATTLSSFAEDPEIPAAAGMTVGMELLHSKQALLTAYMPKGGMYAPPAVSTVLGYSIEQLAD